MILSTEDYGKLMENVAAKSSAQFSLIPPVASTSSQIAEHDYLQNGEVDAEIEGDSFGQIK